MTSCSPSTVVGSALAVALARSAVAFGLGLSAVRLLTIGLLSVRLLAIGLLAIGLLLATIGLLGLHN